MKINVKQLTAYDIIDDGKAVDLKLVDASGNATCLEFQLPELGNLLMTLPSLIEAALRRQHRDGSFRFAHPIGSWSVETASGPAAVLVTLKTEDGFGVSFRVPQSEAVDLGQTLAKACAPQAALGRVH